MVPNLEAPKLEVLKGNGGSVRVGTTGTIGSLMTKELDMKTTPQASTSILPRRKVSNSVSVPCDFIHSPRKLHPRTTLNEASSSGSTSSSNNNNKTIEITRRNTKKSTHHIPILTSDNAAVEITPKRDNTEKKTTHIVEVVDIRCGNPHKWSSPLANRFKKLNSSKLSESIG